MDFSDKIYLKFHVSQIHVIQHMNNQQVQSLIILMFILEKLNASNQTE